MLRNKLMLFLVMTVCFYLVLIGIFGVNGYMYNKSLRCQLEILENNARQLGVDINELIDEKALLTTEEGLRDAAISLGYYVKGDTIHVFEEASLQTSDDSSENDDYFEFYKPLSRLICLGISAGASLLITVLSIVISTGKGKNNDSGKEQSSSHSDDYFINA